MLVIMSSDENFQFKIYCKMILMKIEERDKNENE